MYKLPSKSILAVLRENTNAQNIKVTALADLPLRKVAKLSPFGTTLLHKQLLTMGVRPGQTIQVVRKLPFKGSLYVKIEDRHLAIRESEALQIFATS